MHSSTRKEISCRITRTLLMYVGEANNGALGALLDGLDLNEAYLLDPNNWVSHSFLQILYQRMIDILGDQNAVYNMALASGRFQSLGILDRIARLLGSPRLIYSQAPKYNRILKLNGDVYIHELRDSWVLLEDRYHDSARKTRYDCDYTRGVLAGIPTIFDMPIAEVKEIECQVSAETYGRRIWPDSPTYGCKGCLYRVRFGSRSRVPFWKRLFRQQHIYHEAVQDLLDANQRIQEKYDEAKKLASDLETSNKQLIESKRQLEANAAELESSERRYRLLAESVTQQLLTFSKGGDPVKRPTQLSNPTQDAALFALRGSNVRCDFSFQPDLLPSEVDAGQITQVIYNLILNAVQAMPGGGVIQIRGENIHLLANNGLSLARGDYVKLTIQDSGEGIPKQHIHKVFDPYFTTKQKGSGLGLTVVYAIMDKHDGRVTIDSDSGFGTTFSLYFPATHQIQWKPAVAETPCRSGAGNILIMDDEDFVQDLASEMLTKMGYTVTTVTSGDEAIQAYKTALAGDRGFDAVILDLTIPGGMGGKQAIKALLEMDSDIKAIVSSGYSDDPVMSNYRRYGFQNALKKPYRIKEMSEVLNSVLST